MNNVQKDDPGPISETSYGQTVDLSWGSFVGGIQFDDNHLFVEIAEGPVMAEDVIRIISAALAEAGQTQLALDAVRTGIRYSNPIILEE